MSATQERVNTQFIKQLHGDKVIWVIVFLLSLASIALIYSASSSLAYKEHSTNFSYLIKQLQFVIAGFVTLFICYKIPLGWYRFLSVGVFAASVILLALTPIIGKELNGAKRWIDIMGFSFQPAELVKITIVLYLAKTLESTKLDTFKTFFLQILLPVGITCLFIMIGSVSTALFVGIISTLVLFIAGVKWKYLFYSAGIGASLIVFLIVLYLIFGSSIGIFKRFDTAFSRLNKHFTEQEISENLTAEEKQKIYDKTLQEDMARAAIASVGIIGKGPGQSVQRYNLPHPYSDYIYTIIIEEYGLVGGIAILMLYLCFLYRCVILIKSCAKTFTALTVGGLGLLITFQAFLHILVNVGVLPVTGHTLPLISLGGSSLLILSCAFGIILSVSRTIDVSSKKIEQKEETKEQTKEERKEKEDGNHQIIGANGEFK